MSKYQMPRGYWGIGIYEPKTKDNIGTLWRSAHNFGADFIFTIGKRYQKQRSDTTKAERHIPLYEYESYDDFKDSRTIGLWRSATLKGTNVAETRSR